MNKILAGLILSVICPCQTVLFSDDLVPKVDELGEDFNSELDKDLVVFEEEEEYEDLFEDE